MKSTSKKSKNGHSLREQILKSLMASFKIEGIDIPLSVAEQTLKKVDLSTHSFGSVNWLPITCSRFISVWGFETVSTEILLTKLNI
jgi:hypothetical protein